MYISEQYSQADNFKVSNIIACSFYDYSCVWNLIVILQYTADLSRFNQSVHDFLDLYSNIS